MSNPRHYDHLGHARFVTFSTYRRRPHLTHPAAKFIVQWGINGMRKHYAVKILGYVIMPTHVHLVLVPPIHLTLMNIIKSFKSVTTRAILADAGLVEMLERSQLTDSHGGRRIWQHRGYDHNCRTSSAVIEKINYCHNNPVKAGLVNKPTDWEWSSARWYAGLRETGIKVDQVELEDAGTLIW
jgi:putative transposase